MFVLVYQVYVRHENGIWMLAHIIQFIGSLCCIDDIFDALVTAIYFVFNTIQLKIYMYSERKNSNNIKNISNILFLSLVFIVIVFFAYDPIQNVVVVVPSISVIGFFVVAVLCHKTISANGRAWQIHEKQNNIENFLEEFLIFTCKRCRFVYWHDCIRSSKSFGTECECECRLRTEMCMWMWV